MRHTPRIGGGDLKTNPYYNDPKWCWELGCKARGVNYQCTEFVFQRAQEDCEKRIVYFASGYETKDICPKPLFNQSGYHSAYLWYKDAIWPKTTKGSEARVGDIVTYGTGWGKGQGHVRYIERIEGNYMYLSGGNENYQGGGTFNIKQIIADGGGEDATGLQGYIHNALLDDNADLFINKDVEPDYKELYFALKKKVDAFLSEVQNGSK